MMERFLLVVWILSGWLNMALLQHEYHFVNKNLNWREAQKYCREQHTDLATIRNSEDMKHFSDSLSSAGYSSNVWIGLYSEINWTWSDGLEKSSPEYRNWDTADGDPDFISANQLCVCIGDTGKWFDYDCEANLSLICSKGTPGGNEFVFVNQKLSWSNARKYCQQNFRDLANNGNYADNQQVTSLVPNENFAWMGLYRNENIYWSDQSSFMFRNWDNVANLIGSNTIICGATSTARSGKWNFLSCQTALPFVCYRAKVMKRVIKLTLKPDSSWDPTDPDLQTKLREKLEEKLKERGETTSVKFVVQPGGKIFHKKKKNTEL